MMKERLLNIAVVISCGLLVCVFCFVKLVMLHHDAEDARSFDTITAETEAETVAAPVTEAPETEAVAESIEYAPTDLDLLARVVECEAGSSFVADEHKQLVAKVVINRVNDPRFPVTVYEVVFQGQYTNEPIQYACASRSDFLTLTPSEKSYDIARQVLNGEVTLPDDVIWQAEFPQGETYKTFCYGGTTTYFGR